MASASTSSEEQQRQEQQVKDCVHRTKLIQFLGRTTPIVLQNDNGPCPLLAICNVLLLRNNLNLSPDTVEVSQKKLLELVAERLTDSNSNLNDKDAGYVENQQQNISDAIDLLPRLATGIDVNIKFRSLHDFEFTPECAIFDLLDISLCHGWIVDPQDTGTANAIGSKSYNALTGELVALETQNMEGLSQEDELIRNFLKNNASQLTINGLFCLRDGLKESVLCVFFRNNHFSTMFKFHGELYLLATDQGYINQPDLVWEKLNEVNGDTLFMTGNFKEFRAESRANDTLDGNSRNSQQSGSSDLQLAIALQQKESEQQPQRRNSQRSGSSDLQLAIALQQEESEQQPQRRNSRQSGCSDLQLAIALQQQESEQQPRRRNSQQSGSSDLQLAIALQQEESEQQPHRRNSQQSGNSDLQLAIALQQEESEQQPQRRNSQQSGCSDLQLAIALQQQESEQQPRRRNSQQSGSSDLQLAIALQQEESEQQPRRRNSQQSGSSDLQLAIALQQLESEQQPRRRNSQQSGSFDLQLAIALQQQESEQQPHRPSS